MHGRNNAVALIVHAPTNLYQTIAGNADFGSDFYQIGAERRILP